MKKIALIFNKERSDTVGIYFERAFENIPCSVTHFWTRDAHEISFDYDLYLRIDHGDYKYDVPAGFYPKAFYAIDTHLKKPFKKMVRQLWHYDIIMCAQKEGALRLSRALKRPCYWVPLGCDPLIHKKCDTEKTKDICFVGTFGKKGLRPLLLGELRARYKNSFIGQADFMDMAQLYSGAKIGFNYSLNNDINMRMFEILSCGAFLLTNAISDNGFAEIIEEGRHLITYKDRRDLFAKIDYYLKNSHARARIAEEGHRHARAHHTYAARVARMLAIIRRELGWKEPVI